MTSPLPFAGGAGGRPEPVADPAAGSSPAASEGGGAIKTTCAYCGVGCGIQATITGERMVRIEGDPDHPANRGKLCSKGTHLGETVGLEGRLLHPMIGDAVVGWHEALDEVAGRLRRTIAEHGPDSVAFYVSGQLLTEDYYVVNKLAKGFVGTGNIDTNSRLCMSSAVVAHTRAFGEDVVPCSYDDLDAADLIVLVGSNTAWCHPVIWQRIEAARERHGTRLVVIDPRRTETAERADLHVAISPDGDVALFNALLADMRDRGLLDEEFIADRVSMPDGFWDALSPSRLHAELRVGLPDGSVAHGRARPLPLAQAEGAFGGVDPVTFTALADLVADNPRMVTVFSMGANQSVCGTDKGNAIINLHLATGRINAPGAGPFSITGQPNAMGGREVGGLANMLACHLGFSDSERASVAQFWNSNRLCAGPGLKAVDLFRAVHDGSVKFLWVMATNPAVSMPDAGFVREALARCPTVVVSDVIADTDTGRFAHVRLPALAWGEKDGTVTNSERRVSRQRALFPAPGAARADWRIVCDVARRLGHGEAFDFASPSEVFAEFAAMTGLARAHGKQLDLIEWVAVDQAGYDAMAPFQWGGPWPLAHGFSTPDGRARMVEVAPPSAPVATGQLPLRLNTGRYRDQWHTMTRTGLSPRLSHHRREPLLEIHPADAERWGLTAAGLARVTTSHGSAVFRVHCSEGQRPGEIFAPMHWTDAMSASGRTNRLTRPRTDPHSGQPGFKDTPAAVAPVIADWQGFLVTREQPSPAGLLYWTRSRIEQGWLYELAGDGAFDAAALLPAGERLEAVDPVRGMRRIAVRHEGRLAAALYVTRSGQLPAREWVAGELGREGTMTSEILAGRPSLPAPDTGPLVCICHGVDERTVVAAVDAGAASVAAIGELTCAGTNCGSCRPHLAMFLAACKTPIAEAAE